MRSLVAIAKKFAASAANFRRINLALFGLILLFAGIGIGHTSAPQFVREVWAAMVDGSGTIGTIPVFAASGSTIKDSSIIDDGTNVSIGHPVTIQGHLTLADSATAFGITANKPLNIRATSLALDTISTKGIAVTDGGGIAINGNMTISTSGINTETTDLTLGATNHDVKVLANKFYVNGNPIASVNGRSSTLTAAIKNFVIDHPIKPGYELAHSSLEGPEIGVFYRGTGRLSHGRATVVLPDYFDALTRDGSATVLLTAKGDQPFLLSYDRFDEKSFVVHGAKADGEFDWEVKATRQDVPPLEIERKK